MISPLLEALAVPFSLQQALTYLLRAFPLLQKSHKARGNQKIRPRSASKRLGVEIPVLLRCFLVFLAVLSPSAGHAEPCQMVLVDKLSITLKDGKALVDGAIAQKPVKFILDTGSANSLIDSKSEQFSTTRYVIPGLHQYGPSGEMPIEIMQVPGFQIGSRPPSNVKIRALKDVSLGSDIYGLIGLDFLSQFNVELDIADGVVNLFLPGRCPGQQVYWSSVFSTAAINFPSSSYITSITPQTASESSTPAFRRDFDFSSNDDRHVKIPVILNGLGIEASLDSGSELSLVDTAKASEMGYDPDSHSAARSGQMHDLNGKIETIGFHRFNTFAIADEQITHPLLGVGKISGPSVEDTGSHMRRKLFNEGMVLGLDFIKAHRMIIDFQNGHIYFNYLGGSIFEPPKSKA